MVKKSGNGLQSSAGLMRYYEADKVVIIVGAIVGIIVVFLGAMNHTWP